MNSYTLEPRSVPTYEWQVGSGRVVLICLAMWAVACAEGEPSAVADGSTGYDSSDPGADGGVVDGGAVSDGADGAATGVCDAADADGAACDDGDVCTSGDVCVAGECAGSPDACDDDLDCTADSCASSSGCQHAVGEGFCLIDGACVGDGIERVDPPCALCDVLARTDAWTPKAGAVCNDGDPCTQDDACDVAGACSGAAASCDDNNPCTFDGCLAGQGCTHDAVSAACSDDDPCTLGDACDGGSCVPGKQKKVCDDGNPCTADTCDPQLDCQSVADPGACDDGNPCTTDACSPTSGCSHVDKSASDPCSTGDACIVGQTCSATLLCVGGKATDCDDSNACTVDTCDSAKGCNSKLTDKLSCDDGFACTTADQCTGGVCIGLKTSACPTCTNKFDAVAAKLVDFQFGESGTPGNGIDVDDDPKTCAPQGDCSDGVDNAMSAVGLLVNGPLDNSVKDGTLSFVAEFAGWQGEGKPFTLNMYYAVQTEASVAAGCQPLADVCHWYITQGALGPSCEAKVTFSNAMVKEGKITAGGAGEIFAMEADLIGGGDSTLYVQGARVEGTVTMTADGKAIDNILGVLGGAVPMTVIISVFNSLPEDAFPPGIGKQGALNLLQLLVEPDVDIDGDGKKESASIGLRFSAIGAVIDGMLPPK